MHAERARVEALRRRRRHLVHEAAEAARRGCGDALENEGIHGAWHQLLRESERGEHESAGTRLADEVVERAPSHGTVGKVASYD